MVLLDTHALLWLAAGARLSRAAAECIEDEANGGTLLVSAVSAWEIGILVRKGRIRLDTPPRPWLEAAVRSLVAGRLLALSATAALAASDLPGTLHDDPADRLLVAVARELDIPLLTRDERILAYAEAGHVRAIAC